MTLGSTTSGIQYVRRHAIGPKPYCHILPTIVLCGMWDDMEMIMMMMYQRELLGSREQQQQQQQ